MKLSIIGFAFCLFAATPSMADSKAFENVPRDHWSISAVQQLARWGVSQDIPATIPTNRNFTRYEVAVATARVVDRFGYEPKFASDSGINTAAARDVLVALLYEYRDEYMYLGVQDPMTSGRWEIEAYFRAKQKHIDSNASQWYLYAQNRPWVKDIIIPVSTIPRLRLPQLIIPHLRPTPQ